MTRNLFKADQTPECYALAYREGYQACSAGCGMTDCPYRVGSLACTGWENGWLDADTRLHKQDSPLAKPVS